MASQVLNGSSNPSYTNNTEQNVRVVINYMQNVKSMSWAGVKENPKTFILGGGGYVTSPIVEFAIGKGIENFITTIIPNPELYNKSDNVNFYYLKEGGHYPVEIALAPGQSFSAVCGPYNIVVIKEDGN